MYNLNLEYVELIEILEKHKEKRKSEQKTNKMNKWKLRREKTTISAISRIKNGNHLNNRVQGRWKLIFSASVQRGRPAAAPAATCECRTRPATTSSRRTDPPRGRRWRTRRVWSPACRTWLRQRRVERQSVSVPAPAPFRSRVPSRSLAMAVSVWQVPVAGRSAVSAAATAPEGAADRSGRGPRWSCRTTRARVRSGPPGTTFDSPAFLNSNSWKLLYKQLAKMKN